MAGNITHPVELDGRWPVNDEESSSYPSIEDVQQDELRPPFPYVAGAEFSITRHLPPLTMEERGLSAAQLIRAITNDADIATPDNTPDRRLPFEWYWLTWKTPSLMCLARPHPTTPPRKEPTPCQLVIVDQLLCRDLRGSQVVTCRIKGYGPLERAGLLVAKVFDALYYDWTSEFDPTWRADKHYACEARAYSCLEYNGHDGKFTPRYHDSWTFKIPFTDGRPREVRMVLQDYIPYPTMQSLIDNGRLAQMELSHRMEVVIKAVEAHQWLKHWGVRHEDFALRNILINPDTRAIVVIDFSHCLIRYWNDKNIPSLLIFDKPESPADFLEEDWYAFDDWVPGNMQSDEARKKWVRDRWVNSTDFLQPGEVIRKLDERRERYRAAKRNDPEKPDNP